ncbi:MAG: zinc-ribbon and DUF3426 domain-containing protein [Woeseia sp.]
MYTDCPQCKLTFRVTAQLLRQARGQVRCGGCGNTFDALLNLSEEPAGKDMSSSQSVRIFEEQSRELLKSLGQLTDNDNVRIEDTGVEWRVLDMDGVNDDEGDAEDADTSARVDVKVSWAAEYEPQDDDDEPDDDIEFAPDDWLSEHITDESDDDDGPGTEGFEVSETSANEIEAIDFSTVPDPEDDDDIAGEAMPASQQDNAPQQSLDFARAAGGDGRRDEELRFDDNTPLPDEFYRPVTLSDAAGEPDNIGAVEVAEDPPPAETLRVSIDTGTEADWQELLTEVDHKAPVAEPQSFADEAIKVETEEHVTSAAQPAAADETLANDDAGQSAEAAIDDEAIAAVAVAPDLDKEASDAPEKITADNANQRRARYAAPAPDEYDIDDSLVESIVMEGDTVTDMLEFAERASYDGVPPPDLDDDTDFAPVRKSAGSTARVAGFAAIVLLGVAFAGQYLHANRDALATRGWFQEIVAPVYATMGQPISPAWDISGWQFQSTNGSTDDASQHLTIYTRIANESDKPLPYPLIHVSLTDRWDDVIGSRLLAPQDYLAGAGNPDRPVAAGASFAAVITIETPAPDATGFKLNVCYPLAGKRLRCAIEDFRQ